MSLFDSFAPPCADPLGWRLVEAAGAIRVAPERRPAFYDPGGDIQGGFIAAMLADTLGPRCA